MKFYQNIRFVCALLVLSFVLHSEGRAEPNFVQDASIPSPIAGQGYHLVKNWDFAKTVLSTEQLRKEFYTRYASNDGTLDHLHNEWQRYSDNDNHEISDGALHLIARDPSGQLTPGAVESGMIRSKWETRYGYFEARMKVPKGRGMWPAFWFSAISWPPEIDAVEIVNNTTDDTRGSFHALHGKFLGETVSSKLDKYNVYRPGFDYSEDFHTFAVEWTPTSVRHYVDDVLVVDRKFEWRQDNGSKGDTTPVVVNLAVGGDWPGAPTDLSEFPASLDIAYIRVWQKL